MGYKCNVFYLKMHLFRLIKIITLNRAEIAKKKKEKNLKT